MTATALKQEIPLRDYLVSQSMPAHEGKWLGRIKVSEAAKARGLSSVAMVGQLLLLKHNGVLESLKIGGADGETAYFLVGA